MCRPAWRGRSERFRWSAAAKRRQERTSEKRGLPVDRGISRAVLTHVEFVTVHPFLDGNGRLGRLLMNYALLDAGYPWVTIRSDENRPCFQALGGHGEGQCLHIE
nr:Fic family protein [Gemmatimonas sp.]